MDQKIIIALSGNPNAGKTTIFNAMTRSQAQITEYVNVKSEPNRAMMEVEDSRITILSDMYMPKKTTYALIELIDFTGLTEGSAKEGLFSNSSMGLIKNMDALAIVVRHFSNDTTGISTPLVDIAKIDEELLISDLIIAENRLERIKKAYEQGKKNNSLEMEEKILRKIIDHLSNNQPIRELKMHNDHEKMLRGFQFLTQKPTMVILNSDETNFGKNNALLEKTGINHMVVEFAGKFEMELSQLDDKESIDFFYGGHWYPGICKGSTVPCCL